MKVKDSKTYAATGGRGFADFTNGKPGDEALHQTCFLPRAGQRSRFRLHSLRTLTREDDRNGTPSPRETME
jgi:hypothetical protein